MATITLNVSAFIIPNRFNDEHDDFQCGWWTEALEHFSFCDQPLEIEKDTPCVQLWIHGDGSDNISDHGSNHFDAGEFPSIFPAWIFQGHKENEHIVLKYYDNENDYIINMTLQQKGYRYSRFGNFEEVLDYVA